VNGVSAGDTDLLGYDNGGEAGKSIGAAAQRWSPDSFCHHGKAGVGGSQRGNGRIKISLGIEYLRHWLHGWAMTHPGGKEKRRKITATRPVLRLAPSPNGYLHLGHAFSALFTARVAEALGGRVLLRIEDIDTGRSRREFVDAIFEDLAWLGLEWEEPVRFQSEHFADYGAAIAKLDDKGLLYSSRASRKQIAEAVATEENRLSPRPRDPDGAPFYPREALARNDGGAGQAALRLDMGLALADLPQLNFEDIGPRSPEGTCLHDVTPGLWGDALLARKDIPTSYHVSVVVDDALQGVTHVTRGADLAPATHLHRLLQYHLGLPTPVYCHHPLLRDASGQKLAKSAGSKSLRDLRAEGRTPGDIRAICGIDRYAGYFEALGP